MPSRPTYRGGQSFDTTTTIDNPLNTLILQIKGQLTQLEKTFGQDTIPATYVNVRRIAEGIAVLRNDIEGGIQSTVTLVPGSTDAILSIETTLKLLNELDETVLQLEERLLQPAEDDILSRQSSTSTLELEFESNPVLKLFYSARPHLQLERAKQLFSDSPEAQAAYGKATASFLRRHLDTSDIADGTLRTVLKLIESRLPMLDSVPSTEQLPQLEYLELEMKRIPDADQLRVKGQAGGDMILPIRAVGQAGGQLGWLKAAIDTTADTVGPQDKKGVVRFTDGAFTGGSGTRRAHGGYHPTERDHTYLQKWKRGESIGFTMTASLKAKGLIPRESKTMKGKRVVSAKYK